jgi:hypothetical protein
MAAPAVVLADGAALLGASDSDPNYTLPTALRAPSVSSIQGPNEGPAKGAAAPAEDAAGEAVAARRRRSKSQGHDKVLLMDSTPLSHGPLFSGQPRPREDEELRPPTARHSYTPQRALSKPRVIRDVRHRGAHTERHRDREMDG